MKIKKKQPEEFTKCRQSVAGCTVQWMVHRSILGALWWFIDNNSAIVFIKSSEVQWKRNPPSRQYSAMNNTNQPIYIYISSTKPHIVSSKVDHRQVTDINSKDYSE